jgi:hypothetical protein
MSWRSSDACRGFHRVLKGGVFLQLSRVSENIDHWKARQVCQTVVFVAYLSALRAPLTTDRDADRRNVCRTNLRNCCIVMDS